MATTVTEWLRARLLANVHQYGTFNQARAQKSHDEFFGPDGILWEIIPHAKARKLMGAFRYEQQGANATSYDERARARIGNAKSYIERGIEKFALYQETGNQEFLVDAFNYILLEWARPYHPNPHFASTERHDADEHNP